MPRFSPTLRRFGGIAIVAGVTGAVAAAAAAPTIVNGTFDAVVPLNGTGGGWTSGGNDGAGGWRAAPGNNVSFTNYFIINAGGAAATDPFLSQLIDGFEIGHTYRITGDYENAYTAFGNPAALSFGVEIVELGLLTELAQPAPDGSIGTFAIEFIAAAASYTLRLTSERNGDDSSYGVDNIAIADVSQIPTPEPGTLALVAAGLIGLSRLRRSL